jgi:hypothetical protein
MGSVVFLLVPTRYQGNHNRNQTKGQSGMDRHTAFLTTKTNSNQQTLSDQFSSHIAAFLSVVLINEMLEICLQTSYDQNVQLILKSYLPVVYATPLNPLKNQHN